MKKIKLSLNKDNSQIYYDENLNCFNLLDKETNIMYMNIKPINFTSLDIYPYVAGQTITVTFDYDCIDYNIILDLSEGK